MKIYQSVNTWNKVCKKIGEDPKVIPDVMGLLEEDKKDVIAWFMAKKIAKAFNMVDLENGNDSTPWHYPYFDKSGGGFSFRISSYDYWFVDRLAYPAARLYFRTRSASDFAGETFVKIYKDLIL